MPLSISLLTVRAVVVILRSADHLFAAFRCLSFLCVCVFMFLQTSTNIQKIVKGIEKGKSDRCLSIHSIYCLSGGRGEGRGMHGCGLDEKEGGEHDLISKLI